MENNDILTARIAAVILLAASLDSDLKHCDEECRLRP
jgi:hypothetical protein